LMTFEKLPNAQFDVSDDPNPIASATASSGALVIRHLGGDRISYNDLILAVYDSNKNLLYSKDLATARTDGDVTYDEITASGYTAANQFFEGGEQILASNNTLGGANNAGSYEVVLYYKPTMQPLVDQVIVVT